jgi:hypothetical protein
MMHVDQNRVMFYKFINDDISKESFENWIYENEELKGNFQEDTYVDLLSFNYKSSESKAYIKSIVKKHLNWLEFEKWRTIDLLEKIKNKEIEIILATRRLCQLYREQEDNIDNPLISIELGIGFESVLDNCPIESEYHQWNVEALIKQLEPIKWYQESFFTTVEKELNLLKTI